MLNNLGYVARGMNELDDALLFCDESVGLRREIGDWRGLVLSLENRGYIEIELGRLSAARSSLTETIELALELGYREGISGAILPLGAVEAFEGRFETGIRLMSAALRSDREEGLSTDEAEQRVLDSALALPRATLEASTIDRLWAEGAELNFDDAVTLALATVRGSGGG